MSLADLKALSNISPEELADLREICYKDCEKVEGHLFYRGIDTKKYSQTNFQLRNTRFHMRKAQLSLFLKLKEDENFDIDSWDDTKGVSHLCHRKTCIEEGHLQLETLEHNRERDNCLKVGRCVGHKDRPNCIL